MASQALMLSKYFILSCLFTSCATKLVTFKSDIPAKVSVSSFEAKGAQDEPLGDTPYSTELSKIDGRVVKLSADGKAPAYWFVYQATADNTEIVTKLPELGTWNNGDSSGSAVGQLSNKQASQSSNRILRLTLRSYQALASREFQVARELAEQVSTLNSTLAAPHVIRGLSFMQEGQMKEARAALQRAKTLDPDDADIDSIMKRLH